MRSVSARKPTHLPFSPRLFEVDEEARLAAFKLHIPVLSEREKIRALQAGMVKDQIRKRMLKGCAPVFDFNCPEATPEAICRQIADYIQWLYTVIADKQTQDDYLIRACAMTQPGTRAARFVSRTIHINKLDQDKIEEEKRVVLRRLRYLSEHIVSVEWDYISCEPPYYSHHYKTHVHYNFTLTKRRARYLCGKYQLLPINVYDLEAF